MHLYIYYNVRSVDAQSIRERVRAMQTDLPDRPGRLLRRPEPRDGVETWMEIYENVEPAFEARLTAALDRHGLAAILGSRHVERFEDLA